MSQRKEDWVNITQPDGKQMIAPPKFINKLLGVDKNEANIYNIFNRLNCLETRVHQLESPERQQQVIELLTEEAGRSRMFTWLNNRVRNLDYTDIRSLLNDGTISEEKSGRNSMFFLTSRDTHEVRSTGETQ